MKTETSPRSNPGRRPRRVLRALLSSTMAVLLGACASTPPPPDWQANAHVALNSYTRAYLGGDTRLADLEFARARAALALTGRPDLMARAELLRCAAQIASLVLEPCTAYQALASDAGAAEQNYAAFIAGQWTGIDLQQLPAQYRDLVAQARNVNAPTAATGGSPLRTPLTGSSALTRIDDPLSRLIAASTLLKIQQLAPDAIELAIDAASNQGWRRPLLAWLGLRQQSAQQSGDTATAEGIQRRIDLILQTPR